MNQPILCNYRQRCLIPFEQTRCFDNYNRCFIYHNFRILDKQNPIKTEESEIEKKIKIFGNEELGIGAIDEPTIKIFGNGGLK